VVYAYLMDYTNYIVIKFLVLVGIVVVVNFFYALFTGKTIKQARNDREQELRNSTDPESTLPPDRLK
jgi:hypothetical protein